MSNVDWKLPFLQLRDRLRILYDANQRIFHSILMTPFHSGESSRVVVDELEPVYEGHKLLSEIVVPTEGCLHHAHYFFGDSGSFQQLGRELSGVEGWIQSIPEGLIPPFRIPSTDTISD